jgi:hypothetical protein
VSLIEMKERFKIIFWLGLVVACLGFGCATGADRKAAEPVTILGAWQLVYQQSNGQKKNAG